MCRMAKRRGEWYVGRGLATLLAADDPLAADAPGRTIQLLFEPNGPGNATEPWLLAGKRNLCVGCGSDEAEGQVRFSVVPHAFRKLLPARMKSRDSHDLVVLCVPCYKRAEAAYEARRLDLFRSHGIERSAPRLERPDVQQVRVRSAALALTKRATSHGRRA